MRANASISRRNLSAIILLATILLSGSLSIARPVDGAPAATEPKSAIVSPQAVIPNPIATTREAVVRTGKLEQQQLHRTSTTSATAKNDGSKSGGILQSTPNGLDVPRVGLSLAIVIGLVIAARVAVRYFFPAATVGRSSQAIKVISRSVLAPKQQFLLLQVGKRLIVVGDSGSSMSALAQIDDPDEVASLIGTLSSETPHSSVATFGSLFRKSASQLERASDERQLSPEAVHRMADDDDNDDDEETMPSETTEREIAQAIASSGDEPPDEKLLVASAEVRGLMDRVRVLAEQMRGS